MEVYGYARVSKAEQAEEYDALKQQIARLEKAGAAIVLVDIESGRSDSRKQFNELLKLVERGKVREIIVTRIDRLGRSVVTIYRAFELFDKHKVKVRILDGQVDTSTPFGWLSINQMSGLAEFESRLLSQRIQHGMDYFRSQGKVFFRAPFGYKKIDNKLVANDDIHEASGETYWHLARTFIDLIFTEKSLREACRIFYAQYGIKFSNSGSRQWLDNPSIQGHTAYFHHHSNKSKDDPSKVKQIIYNTHPALITYEEYQKIIAKLRQNRKYWGDSTGSRGNYPLGGMLKCAVCGGGMFRQVAPYKTKKEYIRCSKRTKGNQYCSNSKVFDLADIIRSCTQSLVAKAEEIVDAIDNDVASDDLEPEIVSELKQQLAGLLAMKSNNPAIRAAIADTEAQIQNAQARSDGDRNSLMPVERRALLYSISQADFWEGLSREEIQSIFAELISEVSVDATGEISPCFLL